MEEKIFNELLEGVRELKAVRSGKMKPARAVHLKPESARVVRVRLELSQREFAELLGISIDTLQNWEQGRRDPTGAARVLLKIAALHPELVLEAAKAA